MSHSITLTESAMAADRTDAPSPWSPRRLRVPRDNGAILARPALVDSVDLVSANQRQLSAFDFDVQGRTARQIQNGARTEAVQAAVEYTSHILGRTVPVPDDNSSIILGGHQPAMFHCGVWVKNFAIGEIAARTGGLAINLVVDNDALTARGVRVPVGDHTHPTIDMEPFDQAAGAEPWETAAVRDRNLFESFGRRTVDRMGTWDVDPLAGQIWPDAIEVMRETGSLRDSLTAARHRLERRWGWTNLELPISRLCEMESFLWFQSHLLAHLPAVQRVHNEVLADYRSANRVRSQTHPVPELGRKADWLEAPFWVFRDGDPRRHRLYARQAGRTVELSDGRERIAVLPLAPDMDACCAVEALQELPSRGIRLRTRALTTTMFARAFLGDLFVHGIGGAKYDEMTDRILKDVFGIDPPGFVTLSATLHAPLGAVADVSSQDVRRLKDQQRDLEFSPDRHVTVGRDAAVDQLVNEKRRLIAAEQQKHAPGQAATSHAANYERYLRLKQINRDLQPCVAGQARRLREALVDAESQRAAAAVLTSREYSFALFPEIRLRPFMTSLF